MSKVTICQSHTLDRYLQINLSKTDISRMRLKMNTLQICKVTFSILLSCLLLSKFAVCRQLTLFVPVFFMRNVVILKSIDEDNNWVGLVFTLFFYVQGDQKTLGHKVPNPTSPNFYELWNIPNLLGHTVSSKFFINLMRGKFEVDMNTNWLKLQSPKELRRNWWQTREWLIKNILDRAPASSRNVFARDNFQVVVNDSEIEK